MFFGLFKNKRNKVDTGMQNNASNNSKQNDQASSILNNYGNSRFSLLNIDLNKIELSQNNNRNNLKILTGRAKKSNIPVYTGNPFNPYF